MNFDWDSANISHIARHGVTPDEAEQVIQNYPLDAPAVLRNGEARTVHLGETDAGRVLVVVDRAKQHVPRRYCAAGRKKRTSVLFEAQGRNQ